MRGRLLNSLRGHAGGVTWIEPFGASGLYATSLSGDVRRWDLDDLSVIPGYGGLGHPTLAHNRAGDRIAILSSTGRILVFDEHFELLFERRVPEGRPRVFGEFERDDTLRVISGRRGFLVDCRGGGEVKPCPDTNEMFHRSPSLELKQAPLVMGDGT